ncbi:MAG: type II toxin-antitoxin system RelE/ParE family toxin [Pseudomonadales bacterium]|nr:type II toxin-antitoxin system RelE/ParE family toxin [Pseudomonadales bacterium]
MTKTSTFRLTEDAKTDLISIRRFTLKQWGAQQSLKYLTELRQTILLIASSPGIGIQRSDVDDEVFSFPHASHVIYYTVHQQQLVVFSVLHKNMVPQLHLGDRDII